MNSNIGLIIGFVVVAALAIGAYFYFTSPTNNQEGILNEETTDSSTEGAGSNSPTQPEQTPEPASEETTGRIGESAEGMITTMVEDCANSAENLTLATDGPTISGNPVAVFETTMGTFKAELFTDQAPITACNFAKLIESEFFDGLIFHRVIYEVVPDDGRAPFKFVIQGGDPNCNKVAPGELAPAGQGCGEGGAEETIPLEIVPELRHDSAGILSMARTNDPNSATSQFFVTLGPVPFLDDNYAVYGKVFEGLDIVDTIGQVETGEGDRPVENVVMTKVYLEV